MPSITVQAQPVDEVHCRFVATEPLTTNGERRYADPAEAGVPPLAAAVLEIGGVCEVMLSGAVLTVRRDSTGPSWEELIPRVSYAVEAAAGALPRPALTADGPGDDDTMYEVISEIFQSQINPTVAQHGGRVELIDVQDATVLLRMSGGCQGCGMAHVTLRQGIEAALRQAVPALKGIQDITDHAAGTSPFFSPTGK